MARLSDRLPQNVPGEFFVDSTCIDCETCMILAPGTFAESSDSPASRPTSGFCCFRLLTPDFWLLLFLLRAIESAP